MNHATGIVLLSGPPSFIADWIGVARMLGVAVHVEDNAQAAASLIGTGSITALVTCYELTDATCEGLIAAAEAFSVPALVIALDETLARQRLRAAGSSAPVLPPSTDPESILRGHAPTEFAA